jgi:hypothetical protein
MVEPDRASFSLEPFLFADGELVTWADADVSQSLAESCLPIPSSQWRWRDLRLATTAFASGEGAHACARVRYEVENTGHATKRVRLFAALRPFQVTPPWQSFQGMGGTSPITDLAWGAGAVAVNGRKVVIPLDPPSGFGAAAFEQGGVTRHLVAGELPPRSHVRDDFAHASGALCWDLDLAPGEARAVEVAVPFGEQPPGACDIEAVCRSARATPLDATTRAWQERLGAVGIRLGAAGSDCVDALRTATAHILVNRDAAALQPGPRRYTRSWIRDGATMSAALLRMGCHSAVRDFARWYAPYQAADGNVPCAVDHNGPDWLPEHDSHGQLAFTVAEYWRITGDRDLAAELWPAVLGATRYLEQLRAQRLGSEFRGSEQRACYGLLPESASHEGYLAHPVHAYWDDFWALRGLGDAADLAQRARRGGRGESPAARCRRDRRVPVRLDRGDDRGSQPPIRSGLGRVGGLRSRRDRHALVTTDAARRLPEPRSATATTITSRAFGETARTRSTGTITRPTRSASSARSCGWAGARKRTSCSTSSSPIAVLASGTNGPRSPGATRAARDTSATCPTRGSAPSTCSPCSGCSPYESPDDGSLVLAAGVSEAWLDGEGVEVTGLPTVVGPARLSACGATARTRCASTSPPACASRPEASSCARRSRVRSRARPGDGLVSFDAQSVTLRSSAASVRLLM